MAPKAKVASASSAQVVAPKSITVSVCVGPVAYNYKIRRTCDASGGWSQDDGALNFMMDPNITLQAKLLKEFIKASPPKTIKEASVDRINLFLDKERTQAVDDEMAIEDNITLWMKMSDKPKSKSGGGTSASAASAASSTVMSVAPPVGSGSVIKSLLLDAQDTVTIKFTTADAAYNCYMQLMDAYDLEKFQDNDFEKECAALEAQRELLEKQLAMKKAAFEKVKSMKQQEVAEESGDEEDGEDEDEEKAGVVESKELKLDESDVVKLPQAKGKGK